MDVERSTCEETVRFSQTVAVSMRLVGRICTRCRGKINFCTRWPGRSGFLRSACVTDTTRSRWILRVPRRLPSPHHQREHVLIQSHAVRVHGRSRHLSTLDGPCPGWPEFRDMFSVVGRHNRLFSCCRQASEQAEGCLTSPARPLG